MSSSSVSTTRSPTRTRWPTASTRCRRTSEVLGPLVVQQAYVVPPSHDPLTDDRAPVEWLTDRAILAYIAGGGTLDEQLLPTAP